MLMLKNEDEEYGLDYISIEGMSQCHVGLRNEARQNSKCPLHDLNKALLLLIYNPSLASQNFPPMDFATDKVHVQEWDFKHKLLRTVKAEAIPYRWP
mmetsp:Transcript_21594/g.15830  ORF Transcript_21594/g.15830 Transcript_21594/m.15830 type:complete len:97 (+) Transcript_21594:168-458(+)